MEMVLAMLGVFIVTGVLVDRVSLAVYCILLFFIMLIITLTRATF